MPIRARHPSVSTSSSQVFRLPCGVVPAEHVPASSFLTARATGNIAGSRGHRDRFPGLEYGGRRRIRRPMYHHVQICEGADLDIILSCAQMIIEICRQHGGRVTGTVINPAGKRHGGSKQAEDGQTPDTTGVGWQAAETELSVSQSYRCNGTGNLGSVHTTLPQRAFDVGTTAAHPDSAHNNSSQSPAVAPIGTVIVCTGRLRGRFALRRQESQQY